MDSPKVVAQDNTTSDDSKKEPSTPSTHSKDGINEKADEAGGLSKLPVYTHADVEGQQGEIHLETAADIVTQVIDLDDDPNMNPWTFRMFFIGMGLSCFGAVLSEIYEFKPQVIYVSLMFLTVVAYAAGEAMSLLIPRWGPIGRFLNPHPFNMKEHAAIVIMASSASTSATSTIVVAAQKLYYGKYPNQGAAVFITMATQLIGYGLAGMMRRTLLWPTKMLYPENLPITTVLETLHRDKAGSRKRMKVFWIIFSILLVWELIPEYLFTMLIGFSIFCLADQKSLVFTNLFGGTNGNEGLGFLSISLDWNYIAGFGSPLWVPLQTLTNGLIGTVMCVVMFMALYYGNIWQGQDFPFLSQELFNMSGTNATYQAIYDQTLILNPDNTINDAAVQALGSPWLTSTYVFSLISTNAGFTGNFVHMFLWNYADIKNGWSFCTLRNIQSIFSLASLKYILTPSTYFFWRNMGKRTEEEKQALLDDPEIDPHYKVIVQNNYDECPSSWYFFAFLASFITVMTCLYIINSTLPWWGVIFAIIVLWILLLFFGAQYAITGFQFNVSTVMQTIAGYCFPRAPVANMYFLVLTYNALQQGQYLLRDLKLAQQTKLSPKCTFTTQIIGCVFGALLNYVMMQSIVKDQTEILLSAEGTAIWSGSQIQSINSNGIAWAMAPEMFSFGQRYQWVSAAYLFGFLLPVPFYIMHKIFPKQWIWSYLNMSIIFWYMGYLVVGSNSSVWIYFAIGYLGQWYFRTYRPQQFIKWNYLVSAGMDGGTQVMVFLLSFAVAGASGVARPFPQWWGNNIAGNADRCAYNTAGE
ncbi:hypothetical protein BP6252_11207 [Coleophoma cylindrospora]|uniref:OPT superfamily oligopeptide transporter n=1 Tax=Coleophoma cylindrospora TaxID=1849047 RepID=A0A3D8QPE3_9HELO|nr:hypothetical protein BP6252_11207 [Coleophoma cylindrospora]